MKYLLLVENEWNKMSNVRYFQMENNPDKDIVTPEDHKKIAWSCKESADQFLDHISLTSRHGIAAIANVGNMMCCSFAFELYLKSLLFHEIINPKGKHDLLYLYELLPETVQDQIYQVHPCGNFPKTKEAFLHELKQVRHAFEVLRYSYEKRGLAYNMQFIYESVFVLSEVAGKNITTNPYK